MNGSLTPCRVRRHVLAALLVAAAIPWVGGCRRCLGQELAAMLPLE